MSPALALVPQEEDGRAALHGAGGGRGGFHSTFPAFPACLLLIMFVLDSSSLFPLPKGWKAALPPCIPASGTELHGQMLIETCI